jgi:hydrogenase nickel incorporation protein HypB
MHDTTDEHMLERILASNDELAQHNREHFDELNLFTINFMSAPGAGKTTLLATTINKVADSRCLVIEGDMVGELDAERLRKNGTKVFQISTGRSCHLDAQMIARLLHKEKVANNDFLFIENVGNLVCPAEFPLGEHKRVVLLSVTEGSDKPVKYPVIFKNCDVVIFTKSDLLPYVDFDITSATKHINNLNSNIKTFTVSTSTGEGIDEWLLWLNSELKTYQKKQIGLNSNVSVSTS